MRSSRVPRDIDLRCRLAVLAGLSGLAYAWRQKGWSSLRFPFRIEAESTSYLWSSDGDVKAYEASREKPLIVFEDAEAFLLFAEHGKLRFRLARPFWKCLPVLRFLVGAARLQNHMRGENVTALRRSRSVEAHGEASLWTAVKAMSIYPGKFQHQLLAFSGRRLGFFVRGIPLKPLVGIEVTAAGGVKLIENSQLARSDLSARVIFEDDESLYDAVHHAQPSLQMVGEGRVEVLGLVPFADLIDACLGEMDYLLNPQT